MSPPRCSFLAYLFLTFGHLSLSVVSLVGDSVFLVGVSVFLLGDSVFLHGDSVFFSSENLPFFALGASEAMVSVFLVGDSVFFSSESRFFALSSTEAMVERARCYHLIDRCGNAVVLNANSRQWIFGT